MNLLSGIIIFAAILIVNCFAFSFKAAFEDFNDPDIEEKVLNGDKKARIVAKFNGDRKKLESTLDIVILTSTVIAGGYVLRCASNTLIEYGNFNLVWALASVIMVIFLLVLGVIIPQKLGNRHPEKTVYSCCRFIRAICLIYLPVYYAVTVLAGFLLKPFGINIRDNEDNVTEEEIISMVNEGQEQGVLEANEVEMITNIFELGEKNAGDIMTHRSAIEAVECHSTLDQLIQKHLEGSFSRFPVYDGDIDNIVGTIHIRDALILYRNAANRKKEIGSLKNFLRVPYFVPDTRNIDDLLKEMQAEKVHMGIVVDEYGQTAGIISMEDIIEEIVGNITDEYDVEEPDIFDQKREDIYEVDGLTKLEELSKLLGYEIESEDYDTLNGYLISKLGVIPQDNEKNVVETDGFRFLIEEVSANVIRKVKITRIEE